MNEDIMETPSLCLLISKKKGVCIRNLLIDPLFHTLEPEIYRNKITSQGHCDRDCFAPSSYGNMAGHLTD